MASSSNEVHHRPSASPITFSPATPGDYLFFWHSNAISRRQIRYQLGDKNRPRSLSATHRLSPSQSRIHYVSVRAITSKTKIFQMADPIIILWPRHSRDQEPIA